MLVLISVIGSVLVLTGDVKVRRDLNCCKKIRDYCEKCLAGTGEFHFRCAQAGPGCQWLNQGYCRLNKACAAGPFTPTFAGKNSQIQMKTTVKSPAEVIYSPPDTQMAYTRAQQAGQRQSTSPLSGQKIVAMAFAGAALLVAALSALQLPGLIVTYNQNPQNDCITTISGRGFGGSSLYRFIFCLKTGNFTNHL